MTLHPRTSWWMGVAVLLTGLPAVLTAQKVTKQSITSGGRNRTCYTFVPEGAGPMPLIVVLHGSGRDGMTVMSQWQPLAKKEGIVLAAPDSLVRESWSIAQDGPAFLRDVVESLRADGKIDGRRMYLFGHSAGGHHGIDLALLESEYLAAVAVHAGSLTHDPDLMTAQAERKIPIAMWNGTDDRIVPLPAVRQSRDFLAGKGFDVKLTEMPRHTHDYYGRAAEINKAAWDFLKAHRLEADPKYKEYIITK
jgi:poly(3-hydroxybutyrate) depolymerase